MDEQTSVFAQGCRRQIEEATTLGDVPVVEDVREEVVIIECRVINFSGTTSVEAIYSTEALRNM